MVKKILVMGGTWFIGRVIVEQLLERGDCEVVIFHRGQTGKDLFPQVRRIQGDRETNDYAKATKEEWDGVIDVSSYYPQSLEKMVAALEGKVGRYVYISTVAAYPLRQYQGKEPVAEDFPLRSCTEEMAVAEPHLAYYGEKKAECERVLQRATFLDKVIIRPSIVYGKYDYLDRHYYWLRRIAQEERVLVPHHEGQVQSFTFVDDLARLTLASLFAEAHGVSYNANTHPNLSLMDLLRAMANGLNRSPELVPVSREFLLERDVSPVSDLPLWMDGSLMFLDNQKATTDFEMEWTPLEESFAQTAKHYQELDWKPGQAGMSREKEEDLLREWDRLSEGR